MIILVLGATGTLHVIRHPNPWSLTSGWAERIKYAVLSLTSPADFKGNQQLSSANRGRVRQNPQRRRNKKRLQAEPP